MSSQSERFLRQLLAGANITVGGNRPWDIRVHNPAFFGRVVGQSQLGLGESYMDGWWDCDAIDELFNRAIRGQLDRKVKTDFRTFRLVLSEWLVNRQRISKAGEVGKRHYDLGNDLFQAMLDKRMTYSCGCWQDASDLDEAQEHKLDLVCRKLGLEKGMRVLDIGCGWGSFAKFAAEHYGVSVIGINNSKEQVELGKKLCEGLPVDIQFQDYREVKGTFDRIVSIGMFEHVGPKNYRTFMQLVRDRLTEDGIFLLHTIGGDATRERPSSSWVEKYIFPRAVLPTIKQIGAASEGLFVMEDWHNLSVNYEKTLLAWHQNFERAWPSLSEQYDERFHRMWRFYLLMFAGVFRARLNQVWQVVFAKGRIAEGYRPIRSVRQTSARDSIRHRITA